MTSKGLVAGSSIVETIERKPISFMGSMDVLHTDTRGEAVPVRVGGSYIFALLDRGKKYGFLRWIDDCYNRQFNSTQKKRNSVTPDDPFTPSQRAAVLECNAEEQQWEKKAAIASQTRSPFELPRLKWPQFVYFTDRLNPATAVKIDPGSIPSELGGGYVSKVIVQRADEQLTFTIDHLLPWIANDKQENLSLDKVFYDSFRNRKSLA